MIRSSRVIVNILDEDRRQRMYAALHRSMHLFAHITKLLHMLAFRQLYRSLMHSWKSTVISQLPIHPSAQCSSESTKPLHCTDPLSVSVGRS